MKTRRRIIVALIVAMVPTVLVYAIQRSEGWRPDSVVIERQSLQAGKPERTDLETMCNQAAIVLTPLSHTMSCELTYSLLQPELGTAAARTLVQACNDKHAVVADGLIRLPNASLCRHDLPPACKAICGASQ